ncbi:bifunctional phosphopantothenoylcysteine decarboxylase/phosphopantothenate--cysteine ligase CoaBC [Trichlorobacter sp.]|uniref:bifunctional phosphopantothenoylcysteine decarboxylase/phosphopantothenate--cysteine ligase CoaBC n=1 Tax=Trichlorobacter sp. TaxID=2911007 RepID=UPI002A360424|nr:bifunctional phosphopantothenoylcysteine decarboxylase/phosphopantothenate--cysteine ligase CoaBC [Trichlorobacter sp.]MDY0383124.1 bifunctional phosphopantothenoylcysteine decarboxylase/phosphopantothenate--cysteine ligase CoaBC [Trichlorobacter sp.]
MNLQGKTIVLGVTGGIAVYKAVELLRLLTKAGATVHVIMTRAATEFVTPLTFQTLSGNPVHTELFNLIQEQEIGHISLADRADALVIAPATANCIGKLANGIADDLLTTTAMATKAPLLVAPAMNVNMYEHPAYQENEQKLRRLGCRLVDPEPGFLACGWQGKGRLAPPEQIFAELCRLLTPQDLAGQTVLVTAGPTREELDPIRFISNHSSGRMGYALAQAARQRGARVILISGPVALPAPVGVELVAVESACQMRQAVMERVTDSTVVIKAAAVADYRPVLRNDQKIKKQGERLTIELERNPDILAELGRLEKRPLLVGFAAETTELQAHAATKLAAKNLDMIVANDVTQEGAGFNVSTNVCQLLFRDGRVEPLALMDKQELAHLILDRVLTLLQHRG